MPDIRTTRVALLVDREVDRDVQTSRVALLVDRTNNPNIVIEELYGIADIELYVDNIVEEIYLVADIEYGYPLADTLDQTDEFATDDTLRMLDEWYPTDTFRALRGDLWQLYLDIVDFLDKNKQPFKRIVPPAPVAYDINEDGHVTEADADIVLYWYLYGILDFKPIKVTDTWSIHYHNWPNIFRTWSEAWTQVQTFGQSIQYLGFINHHDPIEVWHSPGDVPITLPNIHTQTDTYSVSVDLNRFSDVWTQDDIFDPDRPAISRAWSDIFYQSDRFDETNLTDIWPQIDTWVLGETQLIFQDHWNQISYMRPPHAITLSQTWTQTQIFNPLVITVHLTDHWVFTGNLRDTTIYVQFGDNWYHTDIFVPPTMLPPLVDDWSSTHLYTWKSNIYTLYMEDDWIQVPNHHSMTHSVYINQHATLIPQYVMGDRFSSEYESFSRSIEDVISATESWRIVKFEEELEHTQTPTDEFEANPLWEDLTDTWTSTETWFQLSGIFYDDILYQTDEFTRSYDPSVYLDIQQYSSDNFNIYKEIYCPEVPRGTFTLIDADETLELRNARWGNRFSIEQTRTVGATRSGTLFVGRRSYWPKRTQYIYTIKYLTDEEFDSILTFLERNLAKQFWWIDHYGDRHRGICLEPASPVRRWSRRRGEIQFTFIDIGEPECNIYDYLQTEEEFIWE